ENLVAPRMNDERADMALDEHTVASTNESLAAIDAAPEPFADRADVKPMRVGHWNSPIAGWRSNPIRGNALAQFPLAFLAAAPVSEYTRMSSRLPFGSANV